MTLLRFILAWMQVMLNISLPPMCQTLISSPNSNMGRLYMVDSQAVYKPSKAGEAEHQPVGEEGGGHQSSVLPHCIHHVLSTGDAEQVPAAASHQPLHVHLEIIGNRDTFIQQ